MAEWLHVAATGAVLSDVHYFFKIEIYTSEICMISGHAQSANLVCESTLFFLESRF